MKYLHYRFDAANLLQDKEVMIAFISIGGNRVVRHRTALQRIEQTGAVPVLFRRYYSNSNAIPKRIQL